MDHTEFLARQCAADRNYYRDEFAGAACTLDGLAAKVVGRQNLYATVGTLDGSRSVEFSWDAVSRVMRTAAGAFRS
jgi:hypothetical protein